MTEVKQQIPLCSTPGISSQELPVQVQAGPGPGMPMTVVRLPQSGTLSLIPIKIGGLVQGVPAAEVRLYLSQSSIPRTLSYAGTAYASTN